jgi:hypothetical protein
MRQVLPYLGIALLLLTVSALWARQLFLSHKTRIKVQLLRKREAAGGSTASHGDLGESVFGLGDWDFVSRNEPAEIQKMFLRERVTLAISWLRRTRLQVSRVMRAHVAVARQSDDLHLATEIKVALSYFLFLILCNSLIGWVWLYGPVRTRKIVGRTLQWAVRLRGAFEQLMATVDPASCRVTGANFKHGTVRS